MFKLHKIILSLIFTLVFSQAQSYASIIINWTSGDYSIPYIGWGGADILNTYNDVTVTTRVGGSVDVFNMYDNSKLTMYGGYISTLNLYPDTTAIIKGGGINYLWIDPTTDGWAKLYAYNIFVSPIPDSKGRISVLGNWLDSGSPFDINLLNGLETIKHVQIIPEPTTLALFGIGILALRRRK